MQSLTCVRQSCIFPSLSTVDPVVVIYRRGVQRVRTSSPNGLWGVPCEESEAAAREDIGIVSVALAALAYLRHRLNRQEEEEEEEDACSSAPAAEQHQQHGVPPICASRSQNGSVNDGCSRLSEGLRAEEKKWSIETDLDDGATLSPQPVARTSARSSHVWYVMPLLGQLRDD